jgi:hypothetical protein
VALSKRKVFSAIESILNYIGSWILDLLAGYGYKPFKPLAWYIGVKTVCWILFFSLGIQSRCDAHKQCDYREYAQESLIASFTAFHGRGVFPESFSGSDPRA